jgi:salicylate 5-hydroxylase large subunit
VGAAAVTEENAQLPQTDQPRRAWGEGYSRVPFWLYTDPGIYQREQERIFGAASWCYVGLSAEIPHPGDFKRSVIGDKPVVVTRDRAGGIHVMVNRCAHRGVQFCQANFGNAREFMCPSATD